MSRIIIGVTVAISLCLAWSCAKKEGDREQSSASDKVVAQELADGGQALYESKCSMCHGSDGTAGIAGAANLQLTPLDSVALERVIADGRNAMPAFKTSLSETEIRDLAGYIMTLKK
ncbi:Cytochrome C oxidase, cbb3-type, subunit III [Chryseolinea serpens]|uniref:Cytochrome C oxidase, cbb3-type, subunit III n=1 Tax=Chryseolinea serpens TaxID=947013 RepID=A0A1M5XB42_9BACT|nr:cytochrome c [Chryseolinea serpens]SHH96959.1 Cytochrome C oxidase, cbb3-type, subunit III [Chryseolinea serpens]